LQSTSYLTVARLALSLASRAVKERKTDSETRSLPSCQAPAASIASPIAPWPKSESFGNMPTFLRTLSSAQVEAFRILRCRSALWLSSLCASSSPLVTNLMPKAPPYALVASVAPRRSPIGTPMGSGLLPKALPKAHRPFLARDPPRLDAGHRLQFRQHLTKSDGKNKPAAAILPIHFVGQHPSHDLEESGSGTGAS
jgi:hypothetical protein